MTNSTPSPDKTAESQPRSYKVSRTLGPVSDLERHLPADWWRTLFNSLYLKTDGDVVENDINTRSEIDALIEHTGIGAGDSLLDLCCGQGRHSLELARRGFSDIHGVDRSRYLIRLARRRARESGLAGVKFSEGDARSLRLRESTRDCVLIMGNSFGYFEREEDDIATLNSVKRVLKSAGLLALDIVDGQWMAANFAARSWEWIDQLHFVNRERSLSTDSKRLISREVVTNAEVGVIADQFYAERLYSFDDIGAMLDSVGFEDIQLKSNLTPHSTRQQDLGLMANRLFVVARAPQKARRKAAHSSISRITVVLGDPRMPDSVKKNGQFNDEDIHTIRVMREALAKLGKYEFTYLDDHATLLHDLLENRPQFVLNLCDEGYRNDALAELHVPAMLEVLQIPYSGAGPGCLSLCYQKDKVAALAASLDIPVPLETYYDPRDQAANIPSIFPALLKPASGDSSIGITRDALVHDAKGLMDYLDFLHRELPAVPVLIQEFLAGAEYSVGLIGNPDALDALPVLEVDYSNLPEGLPQILSYESKWIPTSPYWDRIKYKEAELSDELHNRLLNHCRLLFERLECRDYARFDFRCDGRGEPKLLEVNPNPGWCWDGKLNLMAGLMGLTYEDLLRRIIAAAVRRHERGRRVAHP